MFVIDGADLPPDLSLNALCIPSDRGSAEIVIKNSVFIGTACRAIDVSAAQAAVADVRERYPDASHHAYAYRITGGPQATIGSSDDGEPGGTAGRPMLALLEGQDLWQTVVVGTRYFGGTKLGTGGLARAYASVAREALAATTFVTLRPHRSVTIDLGYDLYGSFRYAAEQLGVRFTDTRFGERVAVTVAIPMERLTAVDGLLQDMSRGEIQLSPGSSPPVYMGPPDD